MKRQYARIGLLVLSILLWNVPSTLAEPIGFDDLYPAVSHLAPLPSGYAGLNWKDFVSMHVPTEYPYGGATGYVAGMVSPYFVVYNMDGGPAEFGSDKPFTFVGAYLTAAWLDGLEITVEGFPDPAGAYRQTVKVSPTAKQWFTFDYKGVNRVTFTPTGGVQLKGYSGSGTFFVVDNLEIAADDPDSGTITIDIKPGDGPNAVNPKSKGVIPVAILSTESFDATTVDPATAWFGPTGTEALALKAAIEDVDRDGRLDMMLFFSTPQALLTCEVTNATLKAQTTSGAAVEGSDSIRPVPCK